MAIILVVDDRVENREFLTTLLGYGGHRLIEATDGAEALAAARAERPDLVITDLLMPTMDGFELVRQLRAEPPLADVKVIFYTATYLEGDARGLAETCGVKHILTKPAEPEVVLRVVNEALEIGSALRTAPVDVEEFQSEHLRLLSMTLAHKAEVVVPRLNAIIDLNVQLASEHDPSRLLETFCAGVRKILGARYALLGLPRTARSTDRRIFVSGLDPRSVDALPAPWQPSGRLATLIEDRRAFRASSDTVDVGLPDGLPPARSFVGAAIYSPTAAYGWLCLADRIGTGEFSDEEVQLAAVLGGLVGRIYENGSLYAAARRHADELAQSEQRFRQLAESIPEVFWVAQVDPFQVLYVSPAYATVWGRPVESLYEKGLSWMESVVPEDQQTTYAYFGRMLRGEPASHEYRIRRPDGAIRWIGAQAFPVKTDGARVERVTGTALDITDRKNVDQQLRQSQKMEAVGRLAGGVAHDFNNLLGVIMGYSEGVMRLLPPDHAGRKKIAEVLKATERAAGVTRQLLTFSRKQVAVPRVLELNAVVGDMEKMLRTLIGEDVKLTTVLPQGVGRIRADAGEIEQVLMNLAVNARDAMPSGGRLTIETTNEDLNEELAKADTDMTPGLYVRLTVTDSGTGIPKDVLPYIFEPFFTTKEAGRGTGLGLSTVYGIIKQSGGYLAVQSEPGEGTSFRIYLPRVDAVPDAQRAPSTAIPRGTETVLIVEDEDLLRQVTAETLENSGYTVLAAADGETALRLATAHAGPIHLVVTDVIMPGLNGRETATRLIEARGPLKVLFVSGYTDDVLLRQGVLPSDVLLLQKPFTAGALARKVREILDAS